MKSNGASIEKKFRVAPVQDIFADWQEVWNRERDSHPG